MLTTDSSEWQKRPALRVDHDEKTDAADWILLSALFGFMMLLTVSPGFRWWFFNLAANILLSSGGPRGGMGSRGGGFGGGGGGFSGGGGSSGGGGASGSW